jgi:hypothetical protein
MKNGPVNPVDGAAEMDSRREGIMEYSPDGATSQRDLFDFPL